MTTALIPMHEVRDSAHRDALAASMSEQGWQGAPLVRWDDRLLTGSHRYAAAKEIGWSDDEIPTVSLEDLFALAGLDFAAAHEAHGSPTIDDYSDLLDLIRELPDSIRAEYGIDLE